MNKLLTNIKHKLSNRRYAARITGVRAISTDVQNNEIPRAMEEERVVTTHVELHARSIVPHSMIEHTEREHFKMVQAMIYGDLKHILIEIKFIARKNNDLQVSDLVDEALTDMGYMK